MITEIPLPEMYTTLEPKDRKLILGFYSLFNTGLVAIIKFPSRQKLQAHLLLFFKNTSSLISYHFSCGTLLHP